MLENQKLRIVCPGVVLVPYRASHVLKYHGWMQNEELLKQTASERLSLEEEVQNQVSWREDPNKCTFIVLDRLEYEKTNDETESMIGDVNMFFSAGEDDPDYSARPEVGRKPASPGSPDSRRAAEVEIMIAEEHARGKGFGKQGFLAMLLYGYEEVGVQCFTVKIGMSNQVSQNMCYNLGFTKVSESQVFQEVHLSLKPDEEWLKFARSALKEFRIVYDDPPPSG